MQEHMDQHCMKRMVKCPFGCNLEIWMGEVESHTDECGMVLIDCPLECEVRFARRDTKHHLTQTCFNRIVTCQYAAGQRVATRLWCSSCECNRRFKCGEQVMSRNKASHEATCEFKPVKCHMGCGEWVRGADRENHEANECRHRQIKCPAGCALFVRANDTDIAEHNANRCEKRLVPCPHKCPEPVRLEALQDHVQMCQYVTFPCGSGRFVEMLLWGCYCACCPLRHRLHVALAATSVGVSFAHGRGETANSIQHIILSCVATMVNPCSRGSASRTRCVCWWRW